MDARDFLVLADRLKDSQNEAERRTSVGRSYYALFNVVLGVSYLTKVKHRPSGSVGLALHSLRTERNRADYDMSIGINVKSSQFVYRKAADALTVFESIPINELDEIVKKIQAMP
jgi:hypothetical protein